MRACTRCGGDVGEAFRFCPWCAEPQRRKIVEFFSAFMPEERGKALRVSRYVREGHVRFSVWDDGVASAAAAAQSPAMKKIHSPSGRIPARQPK